MAQEVAPFKERSIPLFNSPLETGVRSVFILNAAHPRAFDLASLTWLDHLVVHTEDIGGPPSLHPDIPQRAGELLVRRRLVEDGLTLMRRQHLIDAEIAPGGINYRASDEAAAFVESLRSTYSRHLGQRAEWLAEYTGTRTASELAAVIAERIGRWTVEFQADDSGVGQNR